MGKWNASAVPDETCTSCGAVYAVKTIGLPARDNDYFKCECGHMMREWNDTRSWSYTLKQPGRK